MTPILLATGDVFEHTWNTWEIDLVFAKIDLRRFPICEELGITNVVVMMFVVALVLLFVGVRAGNEAKRSLAEGRTPRGLGHLMEVAVAFIRDQITKPQMPHHYRKGFYNSYFCTLFFFVLFCNLIGLVPAPFGHTPTGLFWLNVYLAFGGTFLVILGAGIAEKGPLGFLKGLVPPGVPLFVWPLLFVLEAIGLVIKPAALTIRLTANMTAGHIILAVLMGFLLGDLTFGQRLLVWPTSAFGYVAITALEILIAFIQAYIFTILSAVFVGMSLSHEH